MRIAGVLLLGGLCACALAAEPEPEPDAAQQAQRRIEAIRAQCDKLPEQTQATTAQEVYMRALCRAQGAEAKAPAPAPMPESLVVDAATDLSELPVGYHCHPFAFGKKVCHAGPQ